MDRILVLLSMTFCLIFSGCASKPDYPQAGFMTDNQTLLYGALYKKGGTYHLSPDVYTRINKNSRFINIEQGSKRFFELRHLDPAFDTIRFKCKKTLKINQCERWENREDDFIAVNFRKRGYGELPEIRREKEAKKQKTSKGEVVAHAVMSPFYFAAGAGAAVGVGMALAVVSPLYGIYAVTNPDEAFSRNNWVEFNHDKFNKAIIKAIENSPYNTLSNYLTGSAQISSKLDQISSYDRAQYKKLSVRYKATEHHLKPYLGNDIRLEQKQLAHFSLPEKISLQADPGKLHAQLIQKIDAHYTIQSSDLERFLASEEKRILKAFAQLEKTNFALAQTSSDWRAFIEKYKSSDVLNLLGDAHKNKKAALAQERRDEAHLAHKRASERLQKQKKLAAWRSQLASGDDTFCGPIIELKGKMANISVRAQLQGYGNTAWLRMDEIYPPHWGCRNVNGALSPRNRH